MNNEKEKWMEDVFQSMKGSKRAKPNPELFAKIKGQINASEAKVIPLYQWRSAAAAAVLLLFMNVATLRHYHQQDEGNYQDVAVADMYGESLISSYQIYGKR